MTDLIVNLDAVCARYAYKIVDQEAPRHTLPESDKSKLENTITKSLGVLQEQGVYAFFLFLAHAKKEKGAKQITKQTLSLLRYNQVGVLQEKQANEQDDFPALQKLTEDLDQLLLARELLEQTLIYARYHAKALEERKDDSQQTGETAA